MRISELTQRDWQVRIQPSSRSSGVRQSFSCMTTRPTSSFAYHDEMGRRRRRKLERVGREFRFLRWYGPKEADVGILAWGSSKGAVKEAVLRANRSGKRVAALIPQVIFPVPAEQISEFVAAMKRIAVVELSAHARDASQAREQRQVDEADGERGRDDPQTGVHGRQLRHVCGARS